MSLLLDLGYGLILLASAPRLIYRRWVARERPRLGARLGIGVAPSEDAPIWLHGASVGEVSLLAPLVAELERALPGVPLVISAFSPTGFEAARRAYPRHRVILFPLDFSFAVARVLDALKPRLVVIVESDLWPNFLRAAAARDVPVAVLNGKMSERSFRLHARTRIVPRALRTVSLFALESAEHADRLLRLGVSAKRLHVTGNMKYDLTQPPGRARELREYWRQRLGYAPDDFVVIGGSLHEGEERTLLEAFASLAPAAAGLVLAPRYPGEAPRVADCVRAAGYKPLSKSALDRGDSPPRGCESVLVVDTVGELSRLYAVADVALVGGSLYYRAANKGGHNLIEPAILGVPVVFGPYTLSFAETAERLVAAGGGARVRDAAELAATLAALAADPAARARMGEQAREAVQTAQGATRRNFALLRPLLDPPSVSLQFVAPGPHNAARER